MSWVGSLNQVIQLYAQQIVIGSILFSLFWLVIGWKDYQSRRSRRHHYSRWYAIFDFTVPLYILTVISLNKLCGILLDWVTIAHGTVLAVGLQIIGGLSTRMIMDDCGENEREL